MNKDNHEEKQFVCELPRGQKVVAVTIFQEKLIIATDTNNIYAADLETGNLLPVKDWA